MVYSIAAYTITIGTLALYGVLIHHRSRLARAQLDEASGRPGWDPRKGFNLGASLLAPFWMWRHGLRAPACALFVAVIAVGVLYQREMWVPLLFASLIPVSAGAALGFAGNRIAAEFLAIEKPAAMASSQLPWALAGVVLIVIVAPWALYLGGAVA